eukprot:TRINITY_DN6434_c0_g1_i3.p1 TRINITY_DN6434_c0_g1~~TRINITY_DN6434_c0_g1_i3.p1  ORF type:complete len:269 (+),score=68.63 TRINITY_DN6434_c0_g1_i3:226-1032(+)
MTTEDTFTRAPRKTSLDFASQLQAQPSEEAIKTVLKAIQKRNNYTNNKCVRCLTRSMASQPEQLLHFVDELTQLITHNENGKHRDSRSFILAQHNFLCCVERLYKEAECLSRRPSDTILSITAMAQAAAEDDDDENSKAASSRTRRQSDTLASLDAVAAAAELTDTDSAADVTSDAEDNSKPSNADKAIRSLCQLLHRLYLNDALEGSIIRKWHTQNANMTKVLDPDQNERFLLGLTNFMIWLENREFEEEDEALPSMCEEDVDAVAE